MKEPSHLPTPEKLSRLEAALRSLPISEPNEKMGGLPCAMLIPGFASTMLHLSYTGHFVEFTVTQQNKIGEIIRHSKQLMKLLQDSDLPNSMICDNQFWQREVFLPQLAVLISSVQSLDRRHVRSAARTGRPKKQAAKAIAANAAANFELLTGRRATLSTPTAGGKASGAFLDFLSEVFKILGVDASPESQAKVAIDLAKQHSAWDLREKSEMRRV